VASQVPQPRTDFQNDLSWLNPGGLDNLPQRSLIPEEVLSQALIWSQPIFPQKLADVEGWKLVVVTFRCHN
jgi:hypothetical protein